MIDIKSTSKEDFIEKFVGGVKGELETQLNYSGDEVVDLLEAMKLTRHMVMVMCGSLTREVLK